MMERQVVLIVDDEASISDTITYALKSEGFEPLSCATGAEALKIVGETKVALVVLDVGLPDISGFEVCKKIRTQSNVPVIFLTARSEEVDRILGLELGGDDYVAKPFSPRELVSRVRAVLRRTAEPSKAQKPSEKFQIDSDRMRILFRGQTLELSRYEFRLFCVLIKRPGRVYSREELMNYAWESPEMSLERTVDTHIKTIRQKLKQIEEEDDSIITHRGFGYSLREGS